MKTAATDCKGNTSCRVELIFQNRNKMELCILSGKRGCFSLNCTCAKSQNGGTNLNLDEREFKCNHKKKVMSNACDKEGEQINTTDETAKDDNKKNHVTAIESNKQNNICNNTRGNEKFDNIHITVNGSNLRNKGLFVLLCSYLFLLNTCIL